jgi:hypothetical protein
MDIQLISICLASFSSGVALGYKIKSCSKPNIEETKVCPILGTWTLDHPKYKDKPIQQRITIMHSPIKNIKCEYYIKPKYIFSKSKCLKSGTTCIFTL